MLKNWSTPNGYKEVLRIGLPMVMSMASNTIMQFTDRVFLGNYSVEAIAAALPAGIASFLFAAFFMGVVSYVNVFIAQYIGAGSHQRVGSALWQGLYFALVASLLMAGLYFIAEPIFSMAGHPPEVIAQEVVYFQIMVVGAWSLLFSVALSSFFTGRGRTRPVMAANMIGAVINIPLDYALIFGMGPLPAMGIVGAGLATIASQTVTMILLVAMVFTPANDRRLGVWRNRAFDSQLFGRLMRFGLPGGVQFCLNIFAVTFFVFMVGRLGKIELAATNIVLSIDHVLFMPTVGFSVAVSTMVGQAIGRRRPQDGETATNNTLRLTLIWMGLVVLSFMTFPREIIGLFVAKGLPVADQEAIVSMGVVFLRWVAVYSVFDALCIIYSGAIKGAGDTAFIMKTIATAAVLVMVIPVYLLVIVWRVEAQFVWPVLTLYICTIGLAMWLRFRGGKWKAMRVIED